MTDTQPQAAPPPRRNRVPADLPYVVRPSRRFAWFFRSLLILPLLLVLGVSVWIIIESRPLDPPWSSLWPLGFIVLISCAFMACVWSLRFGGGPRLAIGPEGVWVRGINRPVRAHCLPWEQLDQIWLDREHYLCLRPGDPGLVAGWKGQAGLEVRAAMRRRGAPFTVPLGRHSDRPDAEVLAALRNFSAGQVDIQDLTSH
ncbi:MAG: hypothetical protein ACR2J5_04400 [Geodermatophilaceae bacterium]